MQMVLQATTVSNLVLSSPPNLKGQLAGLHKVGCKTPPTAPRAITNTLDTLAETTSESRIWVLLLAQSVACK